MVMVRGHKQYEVLWNNMTLVCPFVCVCLLAPLGNRSINSRRCSAIWDAMPELTRRTDERMLGCRKQLGWMSCYPSSFPPLGVYFYLWGLLISLCISVPLSFFAWLMQQMRIRAVSVLCRASSSGRLNAVHMLEGKYVFRCWSQTVVCLFPNFCLEERPVLAVGENNSLKELSIN